jgi:hypothetical protein
MIHNTMQHPMCEPRYLVRKVYRALVADFEALNAT